MPEKISVPTTFSERQALLQWASYEARDPRMLAALIIRRALIRRGFLDKNGEFLTEKIQQSGG